jgi:phage protein U
MGMMCLGQFVFALKTLPYQSIQRKNAWRHPSNARVGLRPARQFAGPDDEAITLSGVLLPEFAGDVFALDELREMADEGEAYVLVDGTGKLYGRFVIEDLEETGTVFFRDGTPRRIEFTLNMKRVDDGDVDQLDDDAEAARRMVKEETADQEQEPEQEPDEPEDGAGFEPDDGIYSGQPVAGVY